MVARAQMPIPTERFGPNAIKKMFEPLRAEERKHYVRIC